MSASNTEELVGDELVSSAGMAESAVDHAERRFGPLHGLLALAVLYTLYLAKALIMPIVVALLFSLLLGPVVSALKSLRIPRSVSAVFLIGLLVGPFVMLSVQLAEPAQKWAARLPQLSAELTKELDELGKTLIPDIPAAATNAEPKKRPTGLMAWFQGRTKSAEQELLPAPENLIVKEVKRGGVGVLLATISAAPAVVAQLTILLVLLLFILVFGPSLYSNLVEILPFVRNNRHATLLIGRVRQELSRYMLTVTGINISLGGVTALALGYYGMDDALLWGVLVGLLNFAPYLGPIVAMAMLAIAGLVQYGAEAAAIVPALVFFAINLLEAQFITPTVLGTHMRLNPLVLILWILTWGWLWGPIGVLVAVPLLVCIKLIIAQLGMFKDWVALIETRA